MKLLYFCVAICLTLNSYGQTLDFNDRECLGDEIEDQGRIVLEDGYSITQGFREYYEFGTYCVDHRYYTCSPSLHNQSINGLIKITKDDGKSFTAKSIKVVPIVKVVKSITFLGKTDTCKRVVYKVKIEIPTTCDIKIYEFPDSFTNLVSLEWTSAWPYHQFDDLVLEASPVKLCNYNIIKSMSKNGCTSCPNMGSNFISNEECKRTKKCKKRIRRRLECRNDSSLSCYIRALRSNCA